MDINDELSIELQDAIAGIRRIIDDLSDDDALYICENIIEILYR